MGDVMGNFQLKYDLSFEDLYDRAGLMRLDEIFLEALATTDENLHAQLTAARHHAAAGASLEKKALADLMLAIAPHVDEFVADLFGVSQDTQKLSDAVDDLAPIYRMKRQFIQRRVLKKHDATSAETLDGRALRQELEAHLGAPFTEKIFATQLEAWLADEDTHAKELELAETYAAWASLTKAGYRHHIRGVLFKFPAKREPANLVTLEQDNDDVRQQATDERRDRNGFDLTDAGGDLAYAMDQSHYCLKCHDRDKDSCSTGLKNKEKDKESDAFTHDAHGTELIGCPLEQKISEMTVAAERGQFIAALSIVCVDNPLVAATGHRICNECMSACIFQKQDPVDVPQLETRILKEVLALPWGFEIYALLTRWNPLDFARPLPKSETGRTTLIVGLGPAGFTLAHHLVNEGHAVVGIDGLKIEPLDTPFAPIRDIADHYEPLSTRTMAGFGGVAEYGITVRWDKNFLKIVRLLLERRAQFRAYGGVRLGGTLSIDNAFEAGFDHIALCAGAGRPKTLEIPNGLARGVRAASDFLMALQLTGAARMESPANLQVRLPVVVVGGGLTAVDTATEALAYYPVQVEKFRRRYESLVAAHGEDYVRGAWDTQECALADEFLDHARQLRAEQDLAASENRTPRTVDLLNEWGGVTIAYRRSLQDAPSYRLNHEEVKKAFEEGIRLREHVSPKAVEVDANQNDSQCASALMVTDPQGQDHRLPARTILVAAGTQPNTVLAREESDKLTLNGLFFEAISEGGQVISPELSAKPDRADMLVHQNHDGRSVSFFGDMHPSFTGKVVKAMASAKRGYPIVSRLLHKRPAASTPEALFTRFDQEARPTVRSIQMQGDETLRLTIHAPMAAKAWQPGQFFRLQTFESHAPRTRDTLMVSEAIALSPIAVDKRAGVLSFIVRLMGASTRLCQLLEPEQPVILMGPTGAQLPSEPETTVIAHHASLPSALSTVMSLKASGTAVACHVYAPEESGLDELREHADTLIAHPDMASLKTAVAELASDQILTGPPAFLKEMQQSTEISTAQQLAVVHAPMQCMMKEVCAQCLQPHVDPATGETSFVFSCFNPYQDLRRVDFDTLANRLRQNSVSEKLADLWIQSCLENLKTSQKRQKSQSPAAKAA